jgi:short-subunit dehydrogenase
MTIPSALITGASRGLGRELARKLAARGTEVALVARDAAALEQLAQEIRAGGGRAHVLPADVTDAAAITRVVQEADDRLGGLDLVVANAGVGRERWSGKLAWEDCAGIVGVNVVGATATLTAVVQRMAERRRGHLVGVSSLAQYRGLPRSAAYSASKAYLSRFLEALRIDLRGVGVAVTDLRPGFVRTDLTANNTRPTPFLMDVGPAVDRMLRGIDRRAAVVTFPLPLAAVAGSLPYLPRPLYEAAAARMGGGRRRR